MLTFDEEKEITRKAQLLSLEEARAELERLPTQPVDDVAVFTRAAVARRCIELGQEARRAPPPKDPPLIEVFAPPGAENWSIASLDIPARFYSGEPQEDGRVMIRMPLTNFWALANGANNGSGPSAAMWWEANPILADQLLPKNPTPIQG